MKKAQLIEEASSKVGLSKNNGLPVFKKLIDKVFNCNISQEETKLKKRLK